MLKESPVGYTPPEDTWYPSTVKCFDFDGDGELDIQFVVWRSGAALVYKNSGVPKEHPWPEVLVTRNTDTRMAYASAGDINGDGDLDVVGALEEGGTHQPFIGNYLEWYANANRQGTGWLEGRRIGEADAPNALEVADVLQTEAPRRSAELVESLIRLPYEFPVDRKCPIKDELAAGPQGPGSAVEQPLRTNPGRDVQ